MQNLKRLKGDASHRKFFRKKYKEYNSIVILAKKNKFKNLLVYDAISKVLNKNKILAPKLYQENYKKNYIEIEDFGNETIIKTLKKNKDKKFLYFKDIIKLLNQIQLIKSKKIKNFKNKYYFIPKYKKEILVQEANLFCEWYVNKNLSKNKRKNFNKKFKKIIKILSSSLKIKNKVFVHRDFHVSNMMIKNKRIALIDNQDAILGNPAYDLASLIDDVRIKTSNKLKSQILNIYTRKLKNIDKNEFTNDFEILSVLRNLKIIGIFSRLAMRDKKPKYLRLIPYAWKLIEHRLKNNSKFHQLNMVLKKNPKIKNAN